MPFKKKYLFIFIGIFLILIILIPKEVPPKIPLISNEISSEFSNEQKIKIIGYEGDAMEPYISRDEKYLFFNSYQGKTKKDLYYAEKINDISFQYKGIIKKTNTNEVDANPSMDKANNFYFISTRDINSGDFNTIYTGIFKNGTLENLKKINGSINIDKNFMNKKFWLNMGVEISKDGNTMYTSNARFKAGKNFPVEGDIRLAKKEGKTFNIPPNESEILKNINTDYAIEYAGEASEDDLELFYSQVVLSNPPKFRLYISKRKNREDPFEIPKLIQEPFQNDKNAFVEAPTLSPDGNRLYYHKLDNDKFSIFMLSRNKTKK